MLDETSGKSKDGVYHKLWHVLFTSSLDVITSISTTSIYVVLQPNILLSWMSADVTEDLSRSAAINEPRCFEPLFTFSSSFSIIILFYFIFYSCNMYCLGELPELIAINIFNHLHYNDSNWLFDLKRRLPLIAINNHWRNCGLPFLYGTLIFDFHAIETGRQSTGHINNRGAYSCNAIVLIQQCSNIGLFKGTEYFKLVNDLKIFRSDSHSELLGLDDVLRLITAGLLAVTPPDANHDVFGSTDNILVKTSYLNMSAETMAFNVVEKLYEMFPNIRHLDIVIENFQNDLNHLAKALAHEVSQPLKFYRYEPPKKIMYTIYPVVDIRDAVCGYKDFILVCFPEKCKKEKLESLRILNPSCIFSWQAFDQKSKAIVFPNLRKLTLGCFFSIKKSDITAAEEEHSKLAFPEFPMLRYLKIHIENAYGLVFIPGFIPAHLEKVVLSGNPLAITTFGKLAVRSIGCLEVNLFKDFDLATDEFYQAANRLFRDIEITNYSNVSLKDKMVELDFSKIHWQRIDRLELEDTSFVRTISWLEKLPALTSLIITQKSNYTGLENSYFTDHNAQTKLPDQSLHILSVRKTEKNGKQYVMDVEK